MTLQEELQINVTINNYTQRTGSYSASYDYILLDSLADSSYSGLFRNDLKNLKIKTWNGSECKVLTFQVMDLKMQQYLSEFLSEKYPGPLSCCWKSMTSQPYFQAL